MCKELANKRVKEAIKWLIENNYASSQRTIAEKMMYNPSTLSLILNGKISVTERFTRTFCRVSKNRISADWILTGEGEMVNAGRMVDEEMHSTRCVTIEKITLARMQMEKTIADACARFTGECGIEVKDIGCECRQTAGKNTTYDIRIPLEIPSLGSMATRSDYGINSDDDLTSGDYAPTEFEEAIVGLLLKDNSLVCKISDKLDGKMFSRRDLGDIFEAVQLFGKYDDPIDVEWVATVFHRDKGPLTDLTKRAWNDNHIMFYADEIRKYAMRHKPLLFSGDEPDFTQINPVIDEAYKKLEQASKNEDLKEMAESGNK